MPQSKEKDEGSRPKKEVMSKERIGQISTKIVQLGLRNKRSVIHIKIEDLPRALNIPGEELAEYLETVESKNPRIR